MALQIPYLMGALHEHFACSHELSQDAEVCFLTIIPPLPDHSHRTRLLCALNVNQNKTLTLFSQIFIVTRYQYFICHSGLRLAPLWRRKNNEFKSIAPSVFGVKKITPNTHHYHTPWLLVAIIHCFCHWTASFVFTLVELFLLAKW